jgi:hypothetical protein
MKEGKAKIISKLLNQFPHPLPYAHRFFFSFGEKYAVYHMVDVRTPDK